MKQQSVPSLPHIPYNCFIYTPEMVVEEKCQLLFVPVRIWIVYLCCSFSFRYLSPRKRYVYLRHAVLTTFVTYCDFIGEHKLKSLLGELFRFRINQKVIDLYYEIVCFLRNVVCLEIRTQSSVGIIITKKNNSIKTVLIKVTD